MSIRVQVSEDYTRFGVAVFISQRDNDGRRLAVLHFNDGMASWDEPGERGAPTTPTLSLEHEEANALLAGLANHCQGVDDQRALRKDYTDERGRVDKLIDVVATIAQQRPIVVTALGTTEA